MKPNLTIVDYGMGNLLSVVRAFEHCGAEVTLASTPLLVSKAERLVLPGVGAFGDGMSELRHRNLVEALRNFARAERPMLGICLGMQMLLDGSDEFGATEGLSIIPGWVRQLNRQTGIKLPHIGWSPVFPPQGAEWQKSILRDLSPAQDLYFVHSFYADPANAADCLTLTPYGQQSFCSAIQRGRITGCQFHPEKSGERGLDIVRNFLLEE